MAARCSRHALRVPVASNRHEAIAFEYSPGGFPDELALVLAAHAPTELTSGPAQLGQFKVLASHPSAPVLGLLSGYGPDDPG